MAKPAAAIVLLVPGFALLKEWAYGEGMQVWILPLGLLALLIVSYATRPPSR